MIRIRSKIYILGAETPVYLALLPENTTDPKGKFLAEKKIFDWAAV